MNIRTLKIKSLLKTHRENLIQKNNLANSVKQ